MEVELENFVTNEMRNQELSIGNYIMNNNNTMLLLKSRGYSNKQIIGKLRQLYHNKKTIHNNDYIYNSQKYDFFKNYVKK